MRHFARSDEAGRAAGREEPTVTMQALAPETLFDDGLATDERRASTRRRARGRATIRPAGQFSGWGAFASLVDVSIGGTLFWTPIPQEIGQLLALEVEPFGGGPPLRLEAVVRWVAPAPKRGWTAVGCAWRQRLSHEQLRRLL